MITAVETYTSLTDTILTKAQNEDSQLVSFKCNIEQGTSPECYPLGLRKCFLREGLFCQSTESATQLVVPGSLRTTVLKELHDHLGHSF